jgi:FtsP/CotA-like multicopper oxidase with cupredoxin domain
MGMMPGRGMGARFLINGREFDHRRIDDTVRLGDVEDWEYTNNTDMDHPMHVHTNAFQRVGADGRAEPAWLDGIVVPARGRVRIRTGFSDFTGTSVQHCHILDHEDLGMMSTVRIEA